jgi:hypothetical protein
MKAAQDMVRWQALVNKQLNILVELRVVNF